MFINQPMYSASQKLSFCCVIVLIYFMQANLETEEYNTA